MIHAREKLFLKFKKSKLHIDEENYKKVKYQVQNLIRKKKREFYETNLRQKINKHKELWKTLKSMGLPSKAVTASNIHLKDKNQIVFNDIKNCSIFKNCFSSLAQNLVSKLPLSPNVFTESKIAFCYNNNVVSKGLNFQLLEMSPEKISSILKGLNPSKAAGIDNLSGKFLKDGAHVLARPISQHWDKEISFFFQGLQPQNVLITFLFFMKHSYLLPVKITPDVNNSFLFLHDVKATVGDSLHIKCNFWCLMYRSH